MFLPERTKQRPYSESGRLREEENRHGSSGAGRIFFRQSLRIAKEKGVCHVLNMESRTGNVAAGKASPIPFQEALTMSTTLYLMPVTRPAKPAPAPPSPATLSSPATLNSPASFVAFSGSAVMAPGLTEDLRRLASEEQSQIDREGREAIALLQELARFD